MNVQYNFYTHQSFMIKFKLHIIQNIMQIKYKSINKTLKNTLNLRITTINFSLSFY
jgi:hypothetical protein